MSIKFGFLKGRIYKLTRSVIPNAVRNLKGLIRYSFAPLAMVLLLINGAHGSPIIKNQVEDQNILISQFVGGQPDVLMILDLSGSMALNFGGSEIGNWDNTNVITTCEGFFLDNSSDQYIKSSHCIENAAGTDVCGFQNCVDGICSTQTKMQDVAAAVEAAAGLTQCMKATNCQLSGDTNPACNTSSDYSRFKTCMQTSQAIAANKAFACSGGTTNCTGVPQLGSSRLDMALNVIYSLLDADNSLSSKSCNDPNKLYDGVSTSVNCQNWMATPFRDVSVQVQGTGSGFKLPTSPAEGIIDELTNSDAQILGLRLRALTYSGASWNGCTSNNTFQVAQGGFAGQSQQDLQNFWKFFRGSQSNGGTPLAYALGLDDNNGNGSGGGNVINNDTLGVYKVELQTDPAISCRPEFVIVITDGEDTCSGQCSVTSDSCKGGVTTDANRRSSVQAVSNLRTYYSRNPAPNGGQTFKKEVLTFVIGIGIHDDQAKRTLNAMALTGGTSTKGEIKNTGPDEI